MHILIYRKLLNNLSIRISFCYKIKKYDKKSIYEIFEHCCIKWFRLKKLKFKYYYYLNFFKNRKKYVLQKLTFRYYLKQKLFVEHIKFVLKFKFEI